MNLIYIAVVLLAVGVFLLYFLDRDITDNQMYIVFFAGLAFILLGGYIVFREIPVEILKKKLYGLVLFVSGLWLTFRYPSSNDIQPEGMSVLGIIIGLIFTIFGLYLFVF